MFDSTEFINRGIFLSHKIQQVKVTPAIGARDRNAMRLTLRADQGVIVLLDEALGTQTQKIDLAREIQDALQRYSQKK